MSLVLYVDGALGSDSNSGSSPGASSIVTGTGATWTLDSTTIDLSADAPDLSGVSTDGTESIRINGQTEGENSTDIFTITAVDDGAKTVTVRTSPGASESGITWVIGGATKTIQRAVDTVYNDTTNEPKIWVKNSAPYTESITNLDMGTDTCWLTVEGYGTTLEDNEIAVIDGEETRADGWPGKSGANHVVVKNFWSKNHTSDGFGNLQNDSMIFKRCRASNNDGNGISIDDITTIVDCYSHDNGAIGIVGGRVSQIRNCIVADNGTKGIQFGEGLVWKCLVVGNGTIGIERDASGGNAVMIVASCTIDGKGAAGTTGISLLSGGFPSVQNCIVTGCTTGISGGVATMDREHAVSEENLLFDNGTNYSNWVTRDGEILSDPKFINTDAGTEDWGLLDVSPATDAGTSPVSEGWEVISRADRAFIGAVPPLPEEAVVETRFSPGLHIQGDLG